MLDPPSRHKAEIVALLRPGRDGWSAEDWQVYFDERAGIFEFDVGLPRVEAEARAFACCVVEWLNRNPAQSPPGLCLGCGVAARAAGHWSPKCLHWAPARCRPAVHRARRTGRERKCPFWAGRTKAERWGRKRTHRRQGRPPRRTSRDCALTDACSQSANIILRYGSLDVVVRVPAVLIVHYRASAGHRRA